MSHVGVGKRNDLPKRRLDRRAMMASASLTALVGLSVVPAIWCRLEQRILPAEAGIHRADFRLPDLQGRDVTVAPGREARCVLLFFCPCQSCQALARGMRLSGIFQHRPVVRVIGILRGSAEQLRAFDDETEFPGQLLADESGAVSSRYGVLECPDAWSVRQGSLAHLSAGKHLSVTRLSQRERACFSPR